MLDIIFCEDTASKALQVCAQRFDDEPGNDAGVMFAAFAVHHMQVSAGEVQNVRHSGMSPSRH